MVLDTLGIGVRGLDGRIIKYPLGKALEGPGIRGYRVRNQLITQKTSAFNTLTELNEN